MNKKLYVGNLNYRTTDFELEELFKEVGTVVSVAVIVDRDTGRSKGFGFVEMETEAKAQEAINRFHDYEFNDRKIIVNEARPPQNRGPRGGSRNQNNRGYRD